MAIEVIDTIKPKADFPVVEASDVDVDGKRLSEVLDGKTDKTETSDLSSRLDAKVDNVQAQLDEATSKMTVDSEVVQARVGTDGETYGSLNARISAEIGKCEGTSAEIKEDLTEFTGNKSFKYLKDKNIVISNPLVQGNSQGWESAIIECSEGDIFYIKGSGGGSPRLWMFSNSEGTVLNASVENLNTQEFIKIIAPQNAHYLSVNNKYSDSIGSCVKNQPVFENVENINNKLGMLIENSQLELEHGLIDEYGRPNSGINYARTKWFTLAKKGTKLTLNSLSKRYRLWLYFYNDKKEFIKSSSVIDVLAGTASKNIYIDSDCYFKYRICLIPQSEITSEEIVLFENAIEYCYPKNMLENESFITPESFGAKGDGVTDDTNAIQAAIDTGKNVVFKSGMTYLVSRSTSNAILRIPTNTIIDLNNATIKLMANNSVAYQILLCTTDNIVIKNGTIIGDKLVHTGQDGEQGHCVWICGKNIRLENLTLTGGWGDGIYIGKSEDKIAENITVINCKVNGNRRNGMSITACKSAYIYDCEFNDNAGTAPQSGFDIEPNENDKIEVYMDNIVCKNNGDAQFCLANRYSDDCDVKIGKITTYGRGAYIRSSKKSNFSIDTIHHYGSSQMHITGNSDVDIRINDAYFYTVSQNTSILYTDGIENLRFNNLSVLGNSANKIINNTSDAHINIGKLSYAPMNTGSSISNTDINILLPERKIETITITNTRLKQFVNDIIFDEELTESVIAECFNRNYPNNYTITVYNPSQTDCGVNFGGSIVVCDGVELETITIEAGKIVELKYYKNLGKWLGSVIL